MLAHSHILLDVSLEAFELLASLCKYLTFAGLSSPDVCWFPLPRSLAEVL